MIEMSLRLFRPQAEFIIRNVYVEDLCPKQRHLKKKNSFCLKLLLNFKILLMLGHSTSEKTRKLRVNNFTMDGLYSIETRFRYVRN